MAVNSISATKEEAKAFSWYSFTGTKTEEVMQRTHKRKIAKGQVFGLRPAKGDKFYLIFPDMVHVDFPIETKLGNSLVKRSTKLRKAPKLSDSKDGAKAKGIKSAMRQIMKSQFDSPRFMPKNVKNEKESGYNFSSYQWRQVVAIKVKVNHSKGQEYLHRFDKIGMRFLKESRGGIIIRPDGLRIMVSTEEYDRLVQETPVLPIKEWPNGILTKEDVLSFKRNQITKAKLDSQEMREARRLEQLALKNERAQTARELRQQAKAKLAEERAELEELKRRVKENPVTAAERTEEDKMRDHRLSVQGEDDDAFFEESEFEEDLDDAELDFSYAPEEDSDFDLEDIFSKRQFSSDAVGIEDTFSSLFGDADEVSPEVDPDFDMTGLDEDDDEEEEKPKGKSKIVKRKKEKADVDADEEEAENKDVDSDEEEEAEDDEDDHADLDDDMDDDGDIDGEDLGDEDEEDDTGDDASDDEDEEEDEEAEPEDDADSDTDEAEAEGDEDDSEADTETLDEAENEDDEEDEDVAKAEQEAAKLAKKYAAANKKTPSKAGDPEEGDVLHFKSDSQRRDWLLVKVSNHSASANIVIYTVYDLRNSPDEVRQIRINKGRGQSLFDVALHVKDMKPQLFNRVYDLVEFFDVNKDPIGG